jgi:predicted GIY-YIG superfamily endonuclease
MEHNDSRGTTYTHKHGPWSLIWQQAFESRAQAVVREKQIKGMKSAKWIRENLLNGKVATGRD